MPIINIAHPELGVQKTLTTSETAASATYSLVENNDGFAASDRVLFGIYGQERTEMVTLSGVTSTNQVDHTSGPSFAHPARTQIAQMEFDQIEISRADSEGGSYTVLTTVYLNVDEPDTEYNDTSGSTSSWYKVRYKNSITGIYSDYGDEIQGTGFTDDSLGSMVDEVLEDFGDPQATQVSRESVRNYLNAGVRKLVQTIIKTYPDFRTNYTTQALTASTATYALPQYFLAFKRVDINFSGSSTTSGYKAVFSGEELGYPTTTFSQFEPHISIRGSNFVIRPTPDSSGGYAFIWYWDYPAPMTNDTDEHGLPYGARDILIYYALYRIWLTQDQEKATSFKTMMNDQIDEFVEFIGQQRQLMSKGKVNLVFGTELYDL
jgi:hypothetical protein